jgi:nicotinamide riboside kinase
MAKELSINMNTNEIYEFYKSKLIDPKKLKGKTVLIFELGNVKYIDEIKKYAKNVCIIDDSYNVFFGDVFVNINTLENQIKTFLEKNKMPKFDVAIMNPPYDKTLHLKILEFIIP